MGISYTVSDGKLMLVLEEADEGGFVVTSPIDPGFVTQAETLQEAFHMADDAAECLAIGRRLLAEKRGLADARTIALVDTRSALDPASGWPKARRKRRSNGLETK